MHRAMWSVLPSLMLILVGVVPALAQEPGTGDLLPVEMIDALEGAEWSVDQLVVAPGQRIVVTNRDASPHTFTVEDWEIDVDLPSLSPVEVTVPDDAEPGSTVSFSSTVDDDQELGMTGTIFVVTRDQILAAAQRERTVSVAVANRTTISIDDSFTFSPELVHVAPGGLLEVQNEGSIEHHFVVDEWQLNETIAPGEIVLVQIPTDARVGDALEFYCSVPGHKDLGMTGTLEIDAPSSEPVAKVTGEEGRALSIDLGAFLPAPNILGDQWSRVRTGTADSIVAGRVSFDGNVFPGEGIGAAYVGPSGSRVTVVVMPLRVDAVPSEQLEDAIRDVQIAMMQSWITDNLSSSAMKSLPPPKGCDSAQRISGIVPVTTLPAGATVCQLRAAGVAIFVAVEGEVDGHGGVNGADALLTRLLSGGEPEEAGRE